MKTGRIVATMAVAVLVGGPALAQTADEVIEKHIAASGGRAAYGKIMSRVGTGAISVTTPVGDVSGTIEVYSKKPNKNRTLIKLDLTAVGAGQMTSDQRFDGTSGFVMDTLQGNRTIEGSQLEAMKNGSFPSPLLTYKEMGTSIALGEKQKVGGKDAFVLTMTPKAGPPTRLFIDADSFMLVRTSVTLNVPQLGGDIEQVVDYSDFRDVDGLKIPFVTKSSNPAQTVTATISSVKHNVDIEDASFSKP